MTVYPVGRYKFEYNAFRLNLSFLMICYNFDSQFRHRTYSEISVRSHGSDFYLRVQQNRLP